MRRECNKCCMHVAVVGRSAPHAPRPCITPACCGRSKETPTIAADRKTHTVFLYAQEIVRVCCQLLNLQFSSGTMSRDRAYDAPVRCTTPPGLLPSSRGRLSTNHW